jgi:hypothetical protein
MTLTDLENIVKQKLRQGPASVEQISGWLSEVGIKYSRREAKGIAWKLVEEGEAQFNNAWLLELSAQPECDRP